MDRGRVVILNGGSSSGKTTLGRKLQSALGGVWLLVGVDMFLWMLPEDMLDRPGGFVITEGVVESGPLVRARFESYQHAVAALARTGSDLLIDEVLLDGGADQERWRDILGDLDVLWVGVRCAADVASARETNRGDRDPGMARVQTESVHRGVSYDIEVDSGMLGRAELVDAVATAVRDRWRVAVTPSTESVPKHPTSSAWTSRAPW